MPPGLRQLGEGLGAFGRPSAERLPNPLESTSFSSLNIPISKRLSIIIYLNIKYKHVRAQSCLTLCYPMDCSPPGSSVRGIVPARILEWVAISSSRGSSKHRDQICVSCISSIGRRVLYHQATLGSPMGVIQHSYRREYRL